jgi:serine/threonine protein kinase
MSNKLQINVPKYRYNIEEKYIDLPYLENLTWDFSENERVKETTTKNTKVLSLLYKLQQNHYMPKIDKYFYIIETYEGTLDELIYGKDNDKDNDTSLTIKHIKEITIQLCQALELLSKKGIVYFSLEPKNIGYKRQKNGSYYITLLDFESSKLVTDILNVDFQLQESPQQNPSYRAFRDAEYNESCDMWSLGCIVYEMKTGFQLFPNCSDEMSPEENINYIKHVLGQSLFSSISDVQSVLFIMSLLSASRFRMSALEALQHQWLKLKK